MYLNTIEKNGQLYQVMKVLRVNQLRTAILSNSIGEIIRFKIIGFELEKKDMFIDLISSVGLNRQISFLTDWKIIEQDLKKH